MLVGMARPINTLPITDEQRRELRLLVNRHTATQREVRRAWIILNRSQGLSQDATARRLDLNRPVVTHWEKRFRAHGLAGLLDAKGRGRKPSLPDDKKALVITAVTQPPPGHTRWSVRRMARHAGVSIGSVHGLWKANDL